MTNAKTFCLSSSRPWNIQLRLGKECHASTNPNPDNSALHLHVHFVLHANIYIYIVKSLGNFLHCFWLGFVTESAYVLTEMVKTSTSVFYSKLLHIEGLFNLQICFWACILVMTILPPNKMLLHACMLVIIRWSTLRKCTCVQNLHFLFLVLSSRTSILRL